MSALSNNDTFVPLAGEPRGPAGGGGRFNPALPAPVNNVIRLKVLGKVEEQVTVTTFYYLDSSTVSSVLAAQSMTAIYPLFQTLGGPWLTFLSCLSTAWSGTSTIIDSPNNPTVAPVVHPETEGGTQPGEHLPTQMAASLIKRTLIKGQCGRGRFALPAVPDTWVTSSTITTVAQYNTFAAACLAPLGTAPETFKPCLFSRNGSKTFPGSQGAAGINSIVLNPVLGTSRRRKLGVGI